MPAIQFAGLASGLDSKSIIGALVGVERIPLQRLQAKNSAFDSQKRIVDQLSSGLSALATAGKNLGTAGDFLSYSGSISESSVAKVTASGTSVPGSYSLEVTNLARAQRTYSNTVADATAALSGTDQTLSLTINGTQTDITITAGQNLNDVATAINASGANASAGILYDGVNYRLQVVGRSTGTDNAITFSDTGLGLGLETPANTYQTALNANFTVDGFAVTSASNTISDVLPGTTLELTGTTTGPVDVTIAPDASAVKDKLKKFVDAYNVVAKLIQAQSGQGKGAETLNGDSTVRTIEQGLSRLISNPIPGLTGPNGSTLQLGDLGIETNRDGTLTLDDADLDKALTADFARTATYFAGDGTNPGMGTLLDDLVKGYVNSTDGLLTTRTKGLSDQIKANESRIEDIQRYLDGYQANLEKTYSMLETTMSNLQSQQSYLAQFLNSR